MPDTNLELLSLIEFLEHSQWIKHNIHPPKKPILTRFELQTLKVPKGDYEVRSSGSTGIPVIVQKNDISKLWWMATNSREIRWFNRDVSLTTAVIRANITKPASCSNWGEPFNFLGKTGPIHTHPVSGDLNDWLQKIQPHCLMTYPSILETLDLNALNNLRWIRTTGETLHNSHPLIADTYSAEEVGTIAIQCPDNRNAYHVMENIIVEIVDDSDNPSEVGRVIVTDLTSDYLHRYDIGDYAEIGTCDCGRKLPVIRRILGRQRNMVTLPNGLRYWPKVGSHRFRDIAPVKRYQVIQVSLSEIELRLVVEQPLTLEQETKIVQLVQENLGHPFNVTVQYVEYFPTGKFEEFISKL